MFELLQVHQQLVILHMWVGNGNLASVIVLRPTAGVMYMLSNAPIEQLFRKLVACIARVSDTCEVFWREGG
jgi:hypothetical protein